MFLEEFRNTLESKDSEGLERNSFLKTLSVGPRCDKRLVMVALLSANEGQRFLHARHGHKYFTNNSIFLYNNLTWLKLNSPHWTAVEMVMSEILSIESVSSGFSQPTWSLSNDGSHVWIVLSFQKELLVHQLKHLEDSRVRHCCLILYSL